MTEPSTAAEAPQVPEREIEFHGRQIWVRMPLPEQLLVWQRTLKQLQRADIDVSSWTGEAVMALLERMRKIIDSIILNQVDKDWLDEEMLDGTIQLKDTAVIITKAVDAFAADDNRASRRATTKKAAPKKAATRRKVSRS